MSSSTFVYKPDKDELKGGIIGAGIGAALAGRSSAVDLKMLKPVSKDVFLTQHAKDALKCGASKEGVERIMKERGESLYKEYLSDTEAIVAKVKKNIPSKIAKVAAIGLVVGAGIGFIVKKVKESKAQKADM